MKRVVLKIGGETLKKPDGQYNLDIKMVEKVCQDIAKLKSSGLEIIIVVGGGNFWRGRNGDELDHVLSDQIGMLGTISNALITAYKLNEMGVEAEVMSSVYVESLVPRYEVFKARRALTNGKVVVVGAGTGLPYFTTDMATIQRARELKADTILLAKSPGGVYDKDPKQPDSKKYDEIDSLGVLKIHIERGIHKLAVMDFVAVAMACEYQGYIYVFDIKDKFFIEAVTNKTLDQYSKDNFTIINPIAD
ncbi:MAG: UMP kinase [Bacilli bacterium]|jgi:uridylate kinase|nr:UMP kinase [Bacilli bacterium]